MVNFALLELSIILSPIRLTNKFSFCGDNQMKKKKRKIKYAAIFFLCWFSILVLLVDGIVGFQTLADFFGSYALLEVTLLLLVILPTWSVYKRTKEH